MELCLDRMGDLRGSNHVSLKDSKDPYFYLQHVSGVAKLAIGAGNDDFFIPDHWKEWWPAVPGPKWMLGWCSGAFVMVLQ